ncbi:MAG: TonB-dependent receptor [Ignavibacteriales bacterium]|nr:MAG: TonB-dependent receptor [Ignavibacteriaceae bacterium]MBW7873031.1 carboxypeptidase-like regulatory domain-containing protein [Ignavibacteria bacterium]MCZ2142341.1 TonB-dependent receptor [Ignavibacteriales bacterium]MBV6445225.1 hypothetical protein [Ignavibacteriaceae bacterium]MBZ0195881.1 TonB-dependent receptor [Ignavibacteriaceae bacterium]
MKIILPLIRTIALSLLFIYTINSQSTGNIRGTVTDSTTGEIIPYANVVVKGGKQGSSTNSSGYYFISSVPVGERIIIFSCIGYITREVSIIVKGGVINDLNLQLTKKAVDFSEVTIVGDRNARENETDLGLEKISIKDIELQPVGAELDIFRVIQNNPGVNTTGDATAKYYVRGGGSDQNLVLLNGATVYNPFHALGIFSVIDPETISSLEFYKGGFTPALGDRLSSILNIITRDGNKNFYQGTVQAGLLSGKVAAEGPIPGGSFLLTGRKSYYGDILKKYINEKETPFNFYDFSLKVNFSDPSIDQNSKFVAHTFLSSDQVVNNDPLLEDYHIKNNIIGAKWSKIWNGSPLVSDLNLSYSYYEASVEPNLSGSKPRENKVKDFTINADLAYIYDSKDQLLFGFQNKNITTQLKQKNQLNREIDYSVSKSALAAYINYKFFRWDDVGLDIGVRFNFLSMAEKRPFLFEPRVSLTWLINRLLIFKFAFGRYSQDMVALTNEDELISVFEPWIIVPEHVTAAEATHFIVGFTSWFTDKVVLEVEAYYKLMDNLLEVNDQKFTSVQFDFKNINGSSYGIESALKFDGSVFYSKISYALGWAEKYAKNLTYAPRYDVRHSINILAGINPGANWQFTANWVVASGMPFTPITGFFNKLMLDGNIPINILNNYEPEFLYDTKNSARLPYYHRLDLSITKKFSTAIADFTLGASVLNVYNRENIYYFDKKTGKRINQLPIFPAFFVKAEF